MNRLFKVAGFSTCLAAVLMLNGGHWLALQTVAWGRMIANFSQHDSLGAALSKTFGGQHPCRMCLKIRKGWQEESRQRDQAPGEKPEQQPELVWELRCVTAPPMPLLTWNEPALAPELYSDFIDSPPTPPPRRTAAVL